MTNQIIGSRSFEYNDKDVTLFIHHVLDWWDGERATTGVDIEEAYKCRTCEFEDGCSWRAAKMAELAQRKVNLRPNLYDTIVIPES
jgi:exonuclease V